MAKSGQSPADNGEPAIDRKGLRVADHIPALLAYWDKDQVCRFINKSCKEWFNHDREDVIDKMKLENFLGPFLYSQNYHHVQAVLKGHIQQFERMIPTVHLVRYSLITYIPDKKGNEIEGFFVMVTDVSYLRQQSEKRQADEKQILRALINIQEEERSAIAEKLRDHVNQLLVYVNLMLQGKKVDQYNQAFNDDMRHTIQLAIQELNMLSNDLYPSGLSLLGLLPSIENLLAGYRLSYPQTDISLSCNTEQIEELQNPEKLSVYRIIQDFLTLILRKQQSRLIQAELSYRDHCLMIRILFDNPGDGIDKSNNAYRDIQSRIDYYNGKMREFGDAEEEVCIMHLVFRRDTVSEIN